MKIVIEIPNEWEKDLTTKGMFGEENMFIEFFNRVVSSIKFKNNVCGRYELETAEMLAKAFKNVERLKEQKND